MAATVVTHMMIALNNHISRTPNTNANYKKVVTITEFEKITEVKYKSAIEQSQLPQAGPQLFQYNLNEPAKSVGDGLTRQALKVRALPETKSISEAIVKKATHLLAETKTISDGLTEIDKKVRPISEPAKSISELLVRIAKQVEAISESTTISEGLAASRIYPETIAPETTTISSSVVKVAKKVKSLIETQINVAEALVHVRVAGLVQSPISVSESLAASRIFTKTLADTVFVSGSTYTFTPASFTAASFINSPTLLAELNKNITHPLSQITTISSILQKVRLVAKTLPEIIPVGLESLSRVVNHVLAQNIALTESLISTKVILRSLSQTTGISEGITSGRSYIRAINPVSFTADSFTTDTFNQPSGDIVTITEELEGFPLGQGVRNLLEPSTDISESLVPQRSLFKTISEDPLIIGDSITAAVLPPVISSGGGGINRRRIRRARYSTFLKSLQPIKIKPEPVEHEPLLFETDLIESTVGIQESLTALKIVKQTISVAAATPPPQIIEKEIEKIVYVDREIEVEKEILIEPPPIIQAEPILVSKPKPIEMEQEILVSTQSHSNRMKSRAASAKLHLLEKLKMLTEMEGLI